MKRGNNVVWDKSLLGQSWKVNHEPSTHSHRNARILAVCQALYICAISIDLTLTGLTGYELAPDKSLATLPFAMITVSGAGVSYFAAFLLQWLGRRLGFTLGALIGAWEVGYPCGR
nr:hypothetical protein [Verrucomicrobium spinosum]